MKFLPLNQWPSAVIPMGFPFPDVAAVGFLPLAMSELLLSAHYYPLGLDLTGADPVLGAIIRPDHMVRSMLNANGAWAGAYTPISLRFFPFRLKLEPLSGEILDDLEVAGMRVAPDHKPVVRVKDQSGKLTKELRSIYEGLSNVRSSQSEMRPAIDSLIIAQVITPIGTDTGLHTVDRARVVQLSNHGLHAMTRKEFNAIDIMTALAISQAHLAAGLRPAPVPPTSDAPARSAGLFDGGIDTITPWLDTSELFPVAWSMAESEQPGTHK